MIIKYIILSVDPSRDPSDDRVEELLEAQDLSVFTQDVWLLNPSCSTDSTHMYFISPRFLFKLLTNVKHSMKFRKEREKYFS